MNSYILKKSSLNSIIILSLIFFSPFVIIINYLCDFRGGHLSILFRVFNLCVSCFIILNSIYNSLLNKQNLKINISSAIILLFFFFYLLRMVIDLENYEIHRITPYPKSYYYLYTLGITLIPGIAIMLISVIDYDDLLNKLKRSLIIFNVIIFMFYLYTIFWERRIIYRFWLIKDDFEFLNPITIGSYAALLLLLIHRNAFKNLHYFLLVILCVINLLITGSKGPIVAFIIVFILTFLVNYKLYLKSTFDFFIKLSIFIFLTSTLAIFFGESMITRFINVSNDSSTQIRSNIYLNAYEQFSISPFFGSHFLVIKSKMYSHNILFDIFLTTGLFGFLLLLPIFIKLFFKFLRDRFFSWNSLIFLFLFVLSLFSGSIYSSTELFLCFALIMKSNLVPQLN
jgi:hypothetical protein